MQQSDLLQLMHEFDKSTLSRIKIKNADYSVTFEKAAAGAMSACAVSPAMISQQQAAVPVMLSEPEQSSATAVNAPLVGTFYMASSPDEPPFVKPGDKVKKGQTLCLIEAMKMMNELACPCDGVIAKCYAQNGELVSFGQLIFEVEPC